MIDDPITKRGPYAEGLPEWASRAVASYRESLVDAGRSEATVGYLGTCAEHFMRFACDRGAELPSDIGADVVLSYGRLGGQSEKTSQYRACAARGMLSLMCADGLVRPLAPMLADRRYAAHTLCYEPVEGAPPEGSGMGAERFHEVAGEFMEAVESAGYSRSVILSTRKALGMHYLFLALNGYSYDGAVAASWAESLGDEVGTSASQYRRAIFLFDGWLADGKLHPESVRPAGPDPLDSLPAWASSAIREYVGMRLGSGIRESTASNDRVACASLLSFAVARGACGPGDLDAATVDAWCRSLKPGCSGYASSARGLLEHLADGSLVPAGLALAAKASRAPRARVVEVLGEDEIAAVERALAGASEPMELRDAAMVAIGLELGLRGSDVVGLRRSDIDLRRSLVLVRQRKTGTPVELPLTPVAGNALIAYLLRGRPESDAPTVFVSHRSPFRELTSSGACADAARRVLGTCGFHALRRTYATNILRAGGTRRDVTEALGHTTEASARPYLSLDEERMRMCALGLGELGIGGEGMWA